jgi:3-hydroxybutyryl-CoA dehydrogenase
MTFNDGSCKSLLVAGAGVMGQGIAKLFAEAGIAVTLMDSQDVTVSSPGVKFVRHLPAEPVPDLVIEAVFEDARVKKSVYADIEKAYQGRPVLATNTSGLPLDDLAEGLRYPERFLAMHFFMPADVFPMIEVVRGKRTDDSAVALALSAVRQAGREPVYVERAVNGYVINRLQHSILHEAYHLIAENIATAEVIDQVAKQLLGPRMCITGLLEQKDIAGLEIHAKAQRSIVPSLSHTGVPSPYLQNMVARGDLGVRSGKGFYDWSGRDPSEVQRQANERLVRLLAFLERDRRSAESQDGSTSESSR